MSSRRFCQKAENHLGKVVQLRDFWLQRDHVRVRLIINVKFCSNDHVWQVEFRPISPSSPRTAPASKGNQDASVFCGFLNVIDDQDIDLTFSRFELQATLFDGGEYSGKRIGRKQPFFLPAPGIGGPPPRPAALVLILRPKALAGMTRGSMRSNGGSRSAVAV